MTGVKVILWDTKANKAIKELADGTTLAGVLPPRATIVVEAPKGPVVFTWDGKPARTENGAPFVISGDDHGRPLPWDGLTPGDHLLDLQIGPTRQPLRVHLLGQPKPPAPTPTPPTPPPTPSPSPLTADLPIGPGAKIICVSPRGADVNDGSPNRPIRTLGRVTTAIDPGRQNVILLEAGGSWPEQLPSLPSGPGPDRPTIVASFGPGVRPLVRTPSGVPAGWQQGASNLFFADLDLRPLVPYDYGLRFLSCQDVTIYGCRLAGFRFGLTFEGAGSRRGARLQFRRNVVIDSLGHGGDDSSGIFVSGTDGVRIELNVLDRNGWGDGSPGSMRNHNCYLTGDCTDVAFTNNLSARASSHGLQARPGGQVLDNLFLDNAIGLSYGLVEGDGPVTRGGVTGAIQGNAIVGGRDIGSLVRGLGLQLGNTRQVEISGNLFADELHKGAYPAISLEACGPGLHAAETIGVHGLTFANNQVRNWQTPLQVENSLTIGATGPQSCDSNTPVFDRPQSGPTVGDYARSIGLKDKADLLAHAREQSRAKWDDRLAAPAILAFLKGGK